MKSRHKCICEHSINMALAAVEIYNKPNFPDREQIFSVLMVNAWEALAKAKLLKDGRNRLSVLYIKEKGRYKRNRRTNRPVTIDILTALERCHVPEVVRCNLEHLYDVRNAATHLTAASKDLPLLVFSLGSAALQNYAHLCRDWFGVELNRYNFYIMPLGFSYPFTTLSTLDFSGEPDDVAAIVQSVVRDEDRHRESGRFFLTCQLEVVLVSAKKATSETNLTAKIDPDGATAIVHRPVHLLDRYPYSFTEAAQKIATINPRISRNDIIAFIKAHEIKGNARYAAYHFRNNKEKQRGPSSATTVLYNEEFVQLCANSL